MSPARLELVCTRFFGDALHLLAIKLNKSWKLHVLAALIFGAMALFVSRYSDFLIRHNPFGFSFFGQRAHAIFALFALGFFRTHLSLPAFTWLAGTTALMFLGVPTQTQAAIPEIVASFLLTYVSLIVWIWVGNARFPARVVVGGAIAIVIAEMALLVQLHVRDSLASEAWGLFRPERYLMVVWMIALWQRSKGLAPGESPIKIALLHPIHIIYPLPLFPYEWRNPSSDLKLRLSGLISAAAALAALFMAGGVHVFIEQMANEHSGSSQAATGLFTYFYFYLNSWGLLTMIVGLLRWWGWTIQSPFHFALLAVSPQECWRRWNIPFYHWFRNLIFLPLLRRSRSVFIAVMAVFAMTFFLHDGFGALASLSLPDGEGLFFHLWQKIFFFGFHGLAVWIGIRLWSIWPRSNSATGWLGVLTTWIIMSGIHWWVRDY